MCRQLSPNTFWMLRLLWSALVTHLPPSCFPLRSGSHLCCSTLWMLWVPWPTWFRNCFPLLCPHDFSSDCFNSRDFAPVSQLYLSPSTPLNSLPAWFYISLRLISTWLHSRLSPSWMLLSAWSRTCFVELSPTALWVLFPHDFTLVSNLSPSTLCSAWHDLHLFPTCLHLRLLSANVMGHFALFAVSPPPTTFNQPPPSTFAGSDLKHNEIKLI